MSTIISIVRQDGTVQFDPPAPTIPRNSTVVFRNLDPRAPHLPTPAADKPNLWFGHPLAAFVEGRPADVSDEVFFNVQGPVAYVCALHADEGGTITVS
jgi:plastocyanin